MRVRPIIEQLRAECPLLGGRVFGAAKLAVAEPQSIVTPCAFVVPMSEVGGTQRQVGGYLQEVTAKFGIVIAVTNYYDETGEEANEELADVREEISQALCGWQIPWASFPCEFVDGKIVDYDDLTLRWNDVFSAQFHKRKANL